MQTKQIYRMLSGSVVTLIASTLLGVSFQINKLCKLLDRCMSTGTLSLLRAAG